MRNGRASWPRGKMLGGSSSLNALIYLRGNRRDFDGWSERGNNGWDWESVLPYFKKFENNRDPIIAADTKHHGTGGPLQVGSFGHGGPVKKMLIAAYKELGFRELDNFNADQHLGTADAQGTVDKGVRQSTAKAFLNTAKERSNLHIIKHAHAIDLLWADDRRSGERPVAQGVRFLRDNRIYEARVRKEVIVSAGSVNTPQLLMLSGIGPKTHLAEHNIPQRVNLPVGENLQDHLFLPFLMTFHESTAMPMGAELIHEGVIEFLMHRTGIFTNIGVTSLTTFTSTVNDPKYPNVQFHHFYCPRGHKDIKDVIRSFNFNDDIVETFGRANDRADTIFWVMILINPKSAGSVRLSDADPLKAPLVRPNYFAEASDVRVAIDGMRVLRNLSLSRTFAAHEGEYVRMPLPLCDALEDESDEFWECYVRHMTATLYHPVGTARMGPADDSGAVLDERLRVRGVNGLRVVDASVMPAIVSANTNAATIMIGEKGADLVKQDWRVVDNEEGLRRDEL